VVIDGQVAIDYLSGNGPYADREKHPLPCLVLLDLKMPKVSGLEVLDWIRQQPNLKKRVVVLFSASALPADLDRAYELGVNSYIEKPSTLERTLDLATIEHATEVGREVDLESMELVVCAGDPSCDFVLPLHRRQPVGSQAAPPSVQPPLHRAA
jgi:CheY-like chemotaxis protein